MMKNTLFPIFLKTENIRFLIVGGGNVGLEKTQTLIRQNPSAHLKLVAEEISEPLGKIARQHLNIDSYERAFVESDLEGVDIVIIATNVTATNTVIKEMANKKGLLVNAADQPDLCDFYLGSIINKGSLKIAFSTNGKSPVLARRMREYFQEVIPEDIDDSIEKLHALRNAHKGDFQEKLADLNNITASFSRNATNKTKRMVTQISILFIVFFVGYGLSTVISAQTLASHIQHIPNEFYAMLLVGFIAQLVDGALGLGYGIMCATSMMLFGIRLPAISGSIHMAEMFSSAVSGYTHYKFGNVNKKLLIWLAVPGFIGAVTGALALVYLGNKYEKLAYTVLSCYTILIGIRLFALAFRKIQKKKELKNVGALGFFGGFLDSFGGGGWGPIVTSTLLSKGKKTNYVVGTVSLAEFFVTLASALTFFVSLGVSNFHIIIGLIIGGSIASPIAARLSGKLPRKTALILVSILVTVFGIRVFLKIF